MYSSVNVGLFCSTPAVAVGRSVPRKVAMEMLFTGEPISAKGRFLRFQQNYFHGLPYLKLRKGNDNVNEGMQQPNKYWFTENIL